MTTEIIQLQSGRYEELVKARVWFGIEVSMDDGESWQPFHLDDEPGWGVYDAYIGPLRHPNGWVIPMMTLDTVRRVSSDFPNAGVMVSNNDAVTFHSRTTHHGGLPKDEPYQIEPTVIYDDGYDYEIEPTVIDGMTLYNMGLGLCWLDYSEEVTV